MGEECKHEKVRMEEYSTNACNCEVCKKRIPLNQVLNTYFERTEKLMDFHNRKYGVPMEGF